MCRICKQEKKDNWAYEQKVWESHKESVDKRRSKASLSLEWIKIIEKKLKMTKKWKKIEKV